MTEQASQTHHEIIVGEGITLKPVTVADSEKMFALVDRNRKYLSQYGDITSKKYPTLESMVERNSTQKENEKRFNVWDKGEDVGFCKVTDKGEEGWEIGYYMGEEFAGKGYMTKAAKALTDWTFSNLGADKVFALVHADNMPSRRVLQKLGFVYRGLTNNPEEPDEVKYEMLRPD